MGYITLENISKKYGNRVVLQNIDKTIGKGQSIAFVGHNGCGKSTLLKIIAGLVAPTEGRMECEHSILFHYIPEKFPYVSMTGRSYLMRMGAMDGLKKTIVLNQVETLGEEFFLSELLDIPMKYLSKGSLQKIGVIQAFLKRPDVLLLDEPLSGQDKESQRVFIEKVNQLRSQDTTVLMACHEKKLLDAIAEEVYIISEGRLEVYHPDETILYSVILENDCGLCPEEEMERYGQFYRIKMDAETCDRKLPKLLRQGWKLRRMTDEKND